MPHRIVPPEVWRALCFDALVDKITRPLADKLHEVIRRIYSGDFREIARMANDTAELPISTRR